MVLAQCFLEEIYCILNEFWWHFHVHSTCVNSLPKDAHGVADEHVLQLVEGHWVLSS